jgi:hypothetical protein
VSAKPQALAGAYAKLAWGIEHIQAFQLERDRLLTQLTRPPIIFRQELNTDTSEWVVSVAEVAQFPSLSLFVGDAANNFRSALDYLVSEIAFIDGGGIDRPKSRSQFPLTSHSGYFRDNTGLMLEDVLDSHKTMIERFQPYRRWKSLDFHPLGLLRDISDDDKHRLVVPAPVTAANLSTQFPHWGHDCNFDGRVRGRAITRHPLGVGTEVLAIGLNITGPNPRMEVDTDVPIQISLMNGLPVDYALAEIAQAVEVVLKRFTSFFNAQNSRAIWRPQSSRLKPRPLGGQNVTITKHIPPA